MVDMPMRLTVRQNLTIFGKALAMRHGSCPRLSTSAPPTLDLKECLLRPAPTANSPTARRRLVALAKALINQPELSPD